MKPYSLYVTLTPLPPRLVIPTPVDLNGTQVGTLYAFDAHSGDAVVQFHEAVQFGDMMKLTVAPFSEVKLALKNYLTLKVA